MSRKMILSFVVCACVLGILIIACRPSGQATKGFTEAEVAQVQALLNGVKPESYRIILPEFRDGKVVGSKTYGSLSVTDVRKVASQRNIAFSDSGNAQAVFNTDDGGGAGSHTPSQSPGTDIGRRIEKILAGLDKSQYTLIY